MTPAPGQRVAPAPDDQATRLRELVARLDRARDARQSSASGSRRDGVREDPPIAPPTRMARLIAVASGKGGVGKSNLAVNLCAALARCGLRVILLDADDGLTNADVLCGVLPCRQPDDGDADPPCLIDAPGGFRLAPGASASRARRTDHLPRRLAQVEWLASSAVGADMVVLDCGAGVGDQVLALLALADVTLVVTTPEPTALADAYALVKRRHVDTTGRGRPAGVMQLVVNQASDEADARRAHARLDAVSKRFLGPGVPMGGWIPIDPVVSECVRAQRPFVVARPRSDASRAVRRLARGLAGPGGSRGRGGRWRRWFRWRGR